MAQAKKAEEPSMEEILASIRRIISDEDSQGAETGEVSESEEPVEAEVEDDMGDATEMSQDDLDKLFDMGGDDEASEDEDADDMAAAMAEDAEADEGEDDVLELTEELAVPDDDGMEMVEGLAEDFDAPEGDVSFAEPPAFDPEPEMPMSSLPIPDDLPTVADDGPLTSEGTGEAVHAAFDNLANMFVGSQAQTVEELVKEMLRPMLKAWLDQNLPGMVEQMVQKEIQRVTRRR
ncbi:PopZ family protein [Roseibium sp.]|uniref:PopZ family protein n=1 Tax=Roseibium sp. TaxID=1936156 RepID=UPI003D0E450E